MFKIIISLVLLINLSSQLNVYRSCLFEDAMEIVKTDFDLEKVSKLNKNTLKILIILCVTYI